MFPLISGESFINSNYIAINMSKKKSLIVNGVDAYSSSPESVLGFSDIPDYQPIMLGNSVDRISSKLYEKTPESIQFKRSMCGVHQYEIRFRNKREFSLYIKKSWENPMHEALGMTLSSILGEYQFRFLVNGNTIAMEAVEGDTLDVSYEEFSEDAWFNYGKAIEFAKSVSLLDRRGPNVIITPNDHVINIDFGKLFSNSKTHKRKYFGDN